MKQIGRSGDLVNTQQIWDVMFPVHAVTLMT